MQMLARLLALGLLLLVGCSTAPPPRPPAILTLDLKQLMNWVIDPAADMIWDSVQFVSTESGTKEIRPRNDEQWATVRTGAATVIEAGNLLMVEGRARDNAGWMQAARRLSAAGQSALKAVDAKDPEAVFSAGTQIDDACEGCHDQYAHFSEKGAAAGADKDGLRQYRRLAVFAINRDRLDMLSASRRFDFGHYQGGLAALAAH